MPYGRGGAGNITQAAQDKQRGISDLESQTPPTPQSSSADIPRAKPAPYAHSGRGGAGNWYSPAELAAKGVFSSDAPPNEEGKAPAHQGQELGSALSGAGIGGRNAEMRRETAETAGQKPAVRMGRGGAGNMVWESGGEESRRDKEREREEREERVRQMVRRTVDGEGLGSVRRPEGVFRSG